MNEREKQAAAQSDSREYNFTPVTPTMSYVKPAPKTDAYVIPRATKLRRKVGGDHYVNMAIQPLEYILANNLPFAEGAAIKYISRWRNKGGIQDLKKAIQTLEVIIEHEEQKQARADQA
jgi:hypothetical protein